MSRMLVRLFVVVGFLIAAPTLASAQSLAGAVRDTSGAILPGVTVEASSPALITKVRTSVTDDTGQYRITDLPPGTYKITFTLPGFATVIREGVELTGSYNSMRSFIHAIETAPQFVVIENISLAEGTGEGSLRLALDLSTYYRSSGR